MKLPGKWYVSVYGDAQSSTYADATEVEILEGSRWLSFKSADGKLHVTSYPVNLRTGSAERSEGDRGG